MNGESTKTLETTLLKTYPELRWATQAIDEELGISIDEVRGKSNRRLPSDARAMISYLCCDVPYREMGEYINRDIATVRRHRMVAEDRYVCDPKWKALYKRVLRKYQQISNVE